MSLNIDQAKYGFMLMGVFLISGIVITFTISYYDAVIHNFYILPEQRACWDTKTTNPICLEVYQKVGVPVGDNADLPNAYWNVLNNLVYIISAVIMFIWLGISLVLDSIRKTKPDPISIYFAGVIGATIGLLPLTSWGDYFYFYILKLPLPVQLEWLDHAGLFPQLLKYTGHQHVMSSDLFMAMAIGIAVISVLWIPIIIAFAESKRRSVINLI